MFRVLLSRVENDCDLICIYVNTLLYYNAIITILHSGTELENFSSIKTISDMTIKTTVSQ